jgi:hypothetical protein
MYRADVAISSLCNRCAETIHVRTTAKGRAVRSFSPSGTIVWYDLAYDGNASTSCCPAIAFFCSVVRARGQARLDSFRPIYGDRIATKVTVPTETIAEGLQQIDGITYDFKRFVDAESDLQLAALLPEQKVLMAFDLVFSPKEHVFTVVDHFDHWIIVLESLKAIQGYDTITIGHDTPVHRSAIDSTITYVKRAKEIYAASADAKTYSESLKAAFPDRQLASIVDFSAKLLYAARR